MSQKNSMLARESSSSRVGSTIPLSLPAFLMFLVGCLPHYPTGNITSKKAAMLNTMIA